MSDKAILAALNLRESPGSICALEIELKSLRNDIETSDYARYALTKLLGVGAMTHAKIEQELFPPTG